jgi:hypothetical protein
MVDIVEADGRPHLKRPHPEDYLFVLADHLERPGEVPFEAIAATLEGTQALFAIAHGGPTEDFGTRLRNWVAALRDGEPETWGVLLAGLLAHRDRLQAGVGARLKAISPFRDRVLVAVAPQYGRTDLSGDVSTLFAEALLGAGHELRVGERFLVALDPAVLAGATVVRTRKVAAATAPPREVRDRRA